ncbi:META domain-containing protein [Hyphomicrobium sp. LHD-15]|uniref:META domain-containing protein n=1 Tax=Hyphomicrobium sp. LHD-15 TaxID=3072142 RepID=UPI00280D10AA|nr:META domain-containing protein [Hyphomicrobium sp. LHD-15]MDQ8698899.1 META domain-containing protein [Hyphomicrobium sp. LHD-15]
MSLWRCLIGLSVVLTAASGVRAEDEAGLVGATWLAEDIGGAGVVDNVQSKITIDSAGKVSGSGGCNRLIGSVEVDGDKITFAPPATTRMMCPPAVMDQEGKFIDALQKARGFTLEEPFLRLLGEDRAELVRLIRSEP